MTPVMAYLVIDEHFRQTCVGCTMILAEQGMLVKLKEFPLNGMDEEHSIVVYEIAPGFTLEDCQIAIKARHVGPPWGC
jgi:hypothetical protein